MNSININIDRLTHLLKLYRLSKSDIVSIVNQNLKKDLKESEVFASDIKISLLKKIDSIFKKGINYYIDPKTLKESKDESIFFRKDNFNADLNLGAKQIVNHFEEAKLELSALSKLSNLKMDRLVGSYSIRNSPQKVALEIRDFLYPNFQSDTKEFLKALIAKFAEYNILVFEFVETWNKKEKANIHGMYMSPNVIVLKRNQKSFRREIFTLLHELGHYLLNEEEIDEKVIEDVVNVDSLNKIERWCNDFAYHFLIGEFNFAVSNLEVASAKNDFHHDLINEISSKTHLSTISLYTRLLLDQKISAANYNKVKKDILEEIKLREEQERLEREREKKKAEEEGRKPGGSTPKPIHSPLFVKTIQTAFFEGIINEAEFCKKLNIKPDKLDKYLNEGSN